MLSTPLKPSLEQIEALSIDACDAGRRMQERRSELDWQAKAPRNFVSAADLALEACIRSGIAARFGEVPVLGEEQGGHLSPEQSGWVIDPLDGTSNFLLGLPVWGMSIGYLDRGRRSPGQSVCPSSECEFAPRLARDSR